MAATTWRLRELSALNGSLKLTRVRLLHGVDDVTSGATFSCTHPVSGDPLSVLLDGSGECIFDASLTALPGFSLEITLPAPVDADAIDLQGDAVTGYCLEQWSAGRWILVSRNVQTTPIDMPTRFASDFVFPTLDPSGLARIPLGDGGTASYSAAAGGVGITASGNSVMTRIVATESATVGSEAAIRFKITADPYSRKHFGMFLYDLDNPTYGYRLAGLDNTLVLSYFPGAFGSGESETQHLPLSNGGFNTGTEYTLRIGIGSDNRVSAYVDDALVGTYPNPLTVNPARRGVGTFTYIGSGELYEVMFGGSTNSFNPPKPMRDLPISLVTGEEPVPQGLGITQDLEAPKKLLDTEFGGNGRIFGSVARKGTPANVPLKRRVRLHRSRDGYLARETWSKADGSYEFREISTQYEWDVIAWDHELQEYSTVANNQLAEVMP